MLNKTDAVNSGDAQNQAPIISSNKVQVPSQPIPKTTKNSPLQRLVNSLGRISLSTKATILAMAIGTIPALGIGTIAYSFGSKSMNQRLTQVQQAEAAGIIDNLNIFMSSRYGDIQILANLPFLTNAKLSEATTFKEKQAVLDRFVSVYKAYDNVAIFDVQGRVIAQSTGLFIGNDKQRQAVQDALQKGIPIISQPEVSKKNIYIAAPVKDAVTGQTFAVIQMRLPLSSLADLLANYGANGNQYYLLDNSGKIFLSSQTKLLGKEATSEFPGLAPSLTSKQAGTFKAIQTTNHKGVWVSYIPPKTVAGLPELNWRVLVATDTAIASQPQRQLLWIVAMGTTLIPFIVGAIVLGLAKRTTKLIVRANAAVAKLYQGEFNTRLEITRKDELGILARNINQIAKQLQVSAKEQKIDVAGIKLLADITLRLRRILKTEDIYQTTVKEVQQALHTDRVIIYQFNPDSGKGIVVAESVIDGLAKMLGVPIEVAWFGENYVTADGQVQAIAYIEQTSNLTHLAKFAIKSHLIVPILTQTQLVGLLIAQHCESPHLWQQSEIDLLQQIANQVGYALEQAQLIEQIEITKNTKEHISSVALQQQLLELLNDVESVAKGDLTVRTEVTSGELGTVADFFNSIVESLRDIVTQVKQAATQVNQAVGDNEGAIRQLSETAIIQAGEINRTLDAVDQMTSSMKVVADSAQQAAAIANHAAQTASQSGQAMDLTVQNILSLQETVGETAKKVKRLGEASQQISRVVSLINQIAMQTNLLAINAGIEAARAGEEGQGFVVVAEEVGELAARSAAATQEIEQIVENIQRETSEVVQAMEVGTNQVVAGTQIVVDAKQSLSEILDVSRQIDSLVQSIFTATTSQVQTSQTVSQLMKDIAIASQCTSDSSRQISQSLKQTVEISSQLQETVETFKIS